ncbi:MAG: hypothetical protein FJ102_08620 [Deltaproteobacteria bacterium]|nr:hypothetical protein [Deltaproteobacteria bacterium]
MARVLTLGLVGVVHAGGNVVTEETVCRTAEWVVIAQVIDVGESFVNQDSRISARFLRDVTFRTLGRAHGEPSPTFTLRVSASGAGTVRGFDSFDPDFVRDQRYALTISLYPDSLGKPDVDRLWLGLHARVSATGAIPADTLLQAIWSEHCGSPPSAGGLLRPTEPFLQDIPEWALYLCEHHPPGRDRGDAR